MGMIVQVVHQFNPEHQEAFFREDNAVVGAENLLNRVHVVERHLHQFASLVWPAVLGREAFLQRHVQPICSAQISLPFVGVGNLKADRLRGVVNLLLRHSVHFAVGIVNEEEIAVVTHCVVKMEHDCLPPTLCASLLSQNLISAWVCARAILSSQNLISVRAFSPALSLFLIYVKTEKGCARATLFSQNLISVTRAFLSM